MVLPNSVMVDDLKRRMAGMTLTPAEAADLAATLESRTVDPAERLVRNVRAMLDEYHLAHGTLPDEAFASIAASVISKLDNKDPDRHSAVMKAFRGDTRINRTRDTRAVRTVGSGHPDDPRGQAGVRRDRPLLPEPRTLEDVPVSAPDAVIVAREDIPLELADDIPPAPKTRKLKDQPQA